MTGTSVTEIEDSGTEADGATMDFLDCDGL